MPAPSSVDVALRQQLVTERIKVGRYAAAGQLRGDIERTLRDRFGSVINKGTFNDISAADFQRLLSNVTKDVSGLLTEYKLDNLDFLEELTGAEHALGLEVYSKLSGKSVADLEKSSGIKDAEKLWEKIKSQHMAANGLTMEQTLQSGSDYTMGLIVRRMRQGMVEGEKIEDTLRALLGDDALDNRDGLLNKLENAYRAGSNTNVQHVVSQTQADTSSEFFDYYQWVSTLDERTTAICQDRNGNVYRYGEGPMPPAHWNCRSTTVPATSDVPTSAPKDPAEWLQTQPPRVRKVLGSPEGLAPDQLPGMAKIITQGVPATAPAVAAEEDAAFAVSVEDFERAGISHNAEGAAERALYDEVIGRDPAEFMRELTVDLPSYVDPKRSVKTAAIALFPQDKSIVYTMDFRTPANDLVGRITRQLSITDGVTEAAASYFELEPEYQGGNLAKQVLKNNLAQWQAADVQRVNIVAALDVGGYAWARYGYVPDAASWRKLSRELATKLAGMKDVQAEDRAYLTKLFKSPDARGIWQAADSIFGKRLLLGTDWKGSLDLTDAASMARFNAYVG